MQAQTEHNSEKPQTAIDKVKDASLKAAGYAYLASDAAIFASGIMSKRYKEASSGLFYASGGLVLARYGKQNMDRHIENLSLHLAEYLEKEGVALPEHGQISRDSLIGKGSIIHKTEDFLYRYPAQIFNATVLAAGIQLARSGLTHNKGWDTLAGSAVTAGALTAIFVPESKEKLPRTGKFITDTWHNIRERPLRVTGGLYLLNNAALTVSAIKEYQHNPAQKSYIFKFLYAASAITANVLMSISSKRTMTSAPEHDLEPVYEGAANILAEQPKEVREAIVKHTAGFLAAQPEADVTSTEAEKLLNEAIDRLANKEALSEQPQDESWQSRTSNQSDQPQSLQI